VSEAYRRVRERAGLLEKLELAIPGYRGYKEKELRREADRLIREHLLKTLEPAYRDFKSLMPLVAERAEMIQLYNQVQALFDRAIAKLRTASYGYSGFFDAVKIREAELDKLLEYDWSLAEAVGRVAGAASAAAKAEPAKLGEALSSLRGELLALEDLLRKREEVIKGVTA
jgi:hypothetical protein